jgi:hypothetical protein
MNQDSFDEKLTEDTELQLRGAKRYAVTRTGGTLQYRKADGTFEDYPDQDLGVEILTPPNGVIKIADVEGVVAVEGRKINP